MRRPLLSSLLITFLPFNGYSATPFDNYINNVSKGGQIQTYADFNMPTWTYDQIDPTHSLQTLKVCSSTTGKCSVMFTLRGGVVIAFDSEEGFNEIRKDRMETVKDLALVKVDKTTMQQMLADKKDYYWFGDDDDVDTDMAQCIGGMLGCSLSTALGSTLAGIAMTITVCTSSLFQCKGAIKKMKQYMADNPERYNKDPNGKIPGGSSSGPPSGGGPIGPGGPSIGHTPPLHSGEVTIEEHDE